MLADDILRRNLVQLKRIRQQMGLFDQFRDLDESINETERYLAEYADPVEPAPRKLLGDILAERAAEVQRAKNRKKLESSARMGIDGFWHDPEHHDLVVVIDDRDNQNPDWWR